MADCIKRQSAETGQPRRWSFARFKSKKHEKSAIIANSAVVLEYPASAKAELEMQLAELGFAHWLIPTDDGKRNMVAVVFPLASPILNDPNSGRYSRVASVLLKQIEIAGATEGCIAPTFLIHPIANARIEGFAGTFLEPETYIAQTAELAAKAAAFVGAQQSAADPQDELFQWPETSRAIRTLERCAAEIAQRRHG